MRRKHEQDEERRREAERAAEEAVLQESYAAYKELADWVQAPFKDGTTERRVQGTLSIFAQDGGIKVCIRDRENKRVAFVWAASMFAALRKADRSLASGTLDWRPDRFAV